MDNWFDTLMEQIKMPQEVVESSAFKTAELTEVVVHKTSKCWEMKLTFDTILPIEIYQMLIDLIRAAFQDIASVKIFINTRETIVDETLLNDYYQLALSSLAELSFTSIFKKYRLEMNEGKILIRVEALPQLEHFVARNFPQVEEKLRSYGFTDAELSYEIDEVMTQESFAAHEFEVQKMLDAAVDAQMQIEELKAPQMSDKIKSANGGKSSKSKKTSTGGLLLGREIKPSEILTPMKDAINPENEIVFEGYVVKAEKREFTNKSTKKTSTMLSIILTDYTSSFVAQKWARQDEAMAFDDIVEASKNPLWIRVKGSLDMDNFKHELVLQIQSLQEVAPKNLREDKVPEGDKRVEFHAHTAMSTMDALTPVAKLVEQAAKWGHTAIAITDHSGLQSFPEAHQAGKKAGVKIIYGVEANLVEDRVPIVYNEISADLHESHYVVFDVETTGLSANYNALIQIAAVKMYKGNVTEEFDEFLNPGHPLSQFTTDLTGITDDQVARAKPLKDVLISFQKFCEGSILVAHNATFDVGFMNMNYSRNGLPIISQPVIDTLEFARNLYPELKRHGLGPLTKHFAITLDHHHMANFDAEATGRLLFLFLEEAQKEHAINQLAALNTELVNADSYKKAPVRHATLYALTQKGLKNLFKLVSYSNINYFAGVPRIPKSVLTKHREDILVGTACEEGEVFHALTNKTFDEAIEVAKFYDFIEVQPPALYQPLISTGMIADEQKLHEILQNYIKIGERLKIPVLATGNTHYLNPEDKIYREIIIRSLGAGAPINRPIGHGEFAQPAPLPEAHFRTTDEMLAEFKFLGEEKAYEIVVKNTQELAKRFDTLTPVREDLYTPYMEGSEENIVRLTYETAHKIYGDPLPDIIDARLEKELRSIVGNGFSVIYLIAQQLVHRSNDRGYLVGSRGSVGSSLVATMIGITEVNPLPPHYICPNENCRHFEAYDDGTYGSGFDMPDKDCPDCGTKLIKNGQDIPFETFLGFKGDKVPDIDLNFSGDDQAYAHLDVRDIFGEDYAFRAGTIGTVAEKTAFGFVKGYERDYGKMYRNAEIERLALGAAGVKRTTGQHPGGIIVIPNYMDIYDFSPVQYPADDTEAEWKTTHFDFHAIHDNILKLDILGHDDPTMIRKLQNLSGIDPMDIPMDDAEVLKLFSGTESLGITQEQAMTKLGTFGIPEMGTFTSMTMISDAKPTTFADLLQISGLSHGTDVWKGNAQDLIKQGIATLSTVIGCRDDIMTYLIHKGCDQSKAFNIMEVVRKGRWTKIPDEEREEYVTEMKANNVPNWYIESCAKIKYMFPKAHATAYMMMALRVAWFKVHRPMDYYCAWFSIRATAYDIALMSGSLQGIKEKIKDIRRRNNDRTNPTTKLEQDLLVTLELCNEMRERGFKFGKIDLYESQADEFVIEDNTLVPPFKVMDGLGVVAAQTVVEAREKGEFLSKNELKMRTKLTQTNIDQLAEMGALDGMPDDNQLSLFDM